MLLHVPCNSRILIFHFLPLLNAPGPRRMTFAEIFLFVAGVAVLFRLLRPLQRRLEARLYRSLSTRPRPTPQIIDITEHDKKED